MVISLTLAGHTLDRLISERAFASELHEPLTVPELKQLAETIAKNHGIKDIDRFLFVANCESGWNPNAKSKFYYKGAPEQSYGLYQIHLTAHKDVTYEQAIEPYFNIEWAASHWSDAPHHWKSCYADFSDG